MRRSPNQQLLQHGNSAPQLHTGGGEDENHISVEQKLREQYEFFREEFLTAATNMGIAIPLDIVEDRTHLIQKFLITNGPKYVYQILQTNRDNIQLVRSGLSLLITVLIFLRRLLPSALEYDRFNPSSWYLEQPQLTMEQQWAANQVSKVSDVINVSNLVVIFISTPNPMVQELILSLLSNLVACSDDSIVQILQVPSMFSKLNIGGSSSSGNTNGESGGRPTLKRLTSRINTADTGDIRKSMSNASGTNLLNSNSSFKLAPANRTKLLDSLANVNHNDEGSKQDELNTCLSYILSVVLMQKNRHLLTSGISDIIISMTQHASSQLCEVIARTPTCLLPLLTTDGKGKGPNMLKQLISAGSSNGESIPINPLGSRIIDWAGIRIPLKFLQRYHSLFKKRDEYDRHGNPITSEEDKIMTSALKDEFHYAHNRSLLAVCILICGSNEVARYVYKLDGAHYLIVLASDCFNTNNKIKEPYSGAKHQPGSGGGNIAKYGGGVPGNNGSTDTFDNDLPGVIINALNILQMEKQNEQRLLGSKSRSSMTSGAVGTQLMENSGSRSLGRPKSISSPPSLTDRESFHDSKPNSSSKTKHGRSSSVHGKRLSPIINFSAQSMPNSSPPRMEQRSEAVQLTNTMSLDFQSKYVVETERRKLYIQNKVDDIMRSKSPVSPLQYHAAKTIQKTNSNPLHAQNSQDSLLLSSLEAIDKGAKESILAKKEEEPLESLYIDPSLVFQSTVTATTYTTQHPERSNNTSIADGPILKSSMISPNAHGLSAYRDFFSNIPSSPALPKRIEAKDAIIPGEDMNRIRNKFKLLAEAAVEKTKTSGDGVMYNGKSTVSIEERARKVYAPKRTHYPWEKPPSPKDGSKTATAKHEEMAAKESLEPLSFLDDLFDQGNSENISQSNPPTMLTNPQLDGDDDKTPAWYQQNNFEPHKYGIKLDTMEFEEQNLFDNFKSIFDYAQPLVPDHEKKSGSKLIGTDDLNQPGVNQKFVQEIQQTSDMLLG